MSRPCSSQFALLARIYDNRATQFLHLMQTEEKHADELAQQATHTTDEGTVQVWTSPQQLRECSRAHDRAHDAQQLFMLSVMFQQRANWRAVVQSRLVALRTRIERVCLTYREQLHDLFTVSVLFTDVNPPPLLARCSVLSLCRASNAPSFVHASKQVRHRKLIT